MPATSSFVRIRKAVSVGRPYPLSFTAADCSETKGWKHGWAKLFPASSVFKLSRFFLIFLSFSFYSRPSTTTRCIIVRCSAQNFAILIGRNSCHENMWQLINATVIQGWENISVNSYQFIIFLRKWDGSGSKKVCYYLVITILTSVVYMSPRFLFTTAAAPREVMSKNYCCASGEIMQEFRKRKNSLLRLPRQFSFDRSLVLLYMSKLDFIGTLTVITAHSTIFQSCWAHGNQQPWYHILGYKEGEAGRGSSIGSVSALHASGPKFDPHVRHILSWRLGHENISTAILPLPLIQEEHLSVTGRKMCTKYR